MSTTVAHICHGKLMSNWTLDPVSFSVDFVAVILRQALHRDAQNITQLANCLLPFVPLRKLTESLNGDEVLRDVGRYREILWSPQQVNILP